MITGTSSMPHCFGRRNLRISHHLQSAPARQGHRRTARFCRVCADESSAGRGAPAASPCGFHLRGILRTAVDDARNLQTMPVKRRVFGPVGYGYQRSRFFLCEAVPLAPANYRCSPGCRVLTGECRLSALTINLHTVARICVNRSGIGNAGRSAASGAAPRRQR